MKAYLIDPKEQKFEIVEYSGDFKQIYEILDCRAFDVVRTYENGDVIYVDDEGLFVEDQHFFMHKNYPTPLAGRGLVLGTDEEGEDTEPKTDFLFMSNDISWVGNRIDLMDIVHSHPQVQDYRHLFFM